MITPAQLALEIRFAAVILRAIRSREGGQLGIVVSRCGTEWSVLLLESMYDYEGSRSEFLKLLAECGEEPAFIARARAPRIAIDTLLHACQAKRDELLEWPKFHLSVLALQIARDWSRLSGMLTVPESVALLSELHTNMPTDKSVQRSWLVSDRAALRTFLESGERFNRHWRAHLDGLDLEGVNKPRREYNQYFVLEKACAFGSERVTQGFEPLGMIDRAYLYERFPLLTLPSLA